MTGPPGRTGRRTPPGNGELLAADLLEQVGAGQYDHVVYINGIHMKERLFTFGSGVQEREYDSLWRSPYAASFSSGGLGAESPTIAIAVKARDQMLNYGPVYSEYYRWFRWMMVLSAAGAVAGLALLVLLGTLSPTAPSARRSAPSPPRGSVMVEVSSPLGRRARLRRVDAVGDVQRGAWPRARHLRLSALLLVVLARAGRPCRQRQGVFPEQHPHVGRAVHEEPREPL